MEQSKRMISKYKEQFIIQLQELERGLKDGYDHKELSQKALKLKQVKIYVKNLMEGLNKLS